MTTPSHLVMTAALRRSLGPACGAGRAFLVGSVAPDVPLYLLSLGALVYYRGLLGWPRSQVWTHVYDHLFFEHPVWVSAHNLLHAPLVLGAGLVACALLGPRTRAVRWFLLGCALHAAVDVLTHHDDEPLVLFPFDWTTRWRSPVSYWDERHYGAPFAVGELGLDARCCWPISGEGRRRWAGSRRGEAQGKVGVVPSIDARNRTSAWRSAGSPSVSVPPVPALRWVTFANTSSSVWAAPLCR